MYKCLVNSDLGTYFFSFSFILSKFSLRALLTSSNEPTCIFFFLFEPFFPQFLPRCGKPVPTIPVFVEREGSGVRG